MLFYLNEAPVLCLKKIPATRAHPPFSSPLCAPSDNVRRHAKDDLKVLSEKLDKFVTVVEANTLRVFRSLHSTWHTWRRPKDIAVSMCLILQTSCQLPGP